MPFSFRKLYIPGIELIEPKIFDDKRGVFAEIYKLSDFKQYGINKTFVQINQSYSKKGVLRGLHYQMSPQAQDKLIRVLSGEIFDVAVDIRKNSPFYGQFVTETLSSMNKKMLYVPQGFAHGFLVLSELAEVVYYCTREYSKKHERGIIWNDPQLRINWPVDNPILSEKDAQLPTLDAIENNFDYNH